MQMQLDYWAVRKFDNNDQLAYFHSTPLRTVVRTRRQGAVVIYHSVLVYMRDTWNSYKWLQSHHTNFMRSFWLPF